jgi:hypothetical protein
VGLKLFELPLREKVMYEPVHDRSLLLHTQIRFRDSNGLSNMKIGQRNSGFQYSGVTRLG